MYHLSLLYLNPPAGGTIGTKERVIFLINNRDMIGVKGYAPRPPVRDSKGYSVVMLKSYIAKWETFVHEIGHTYSLKHPFDMSNQYRKGSTTNFMDYSPKINMFWKWQWETINSTDF